MVVVFQKVKIFFFELLYKEKDLFWNFRASPYSHGYLLCLIKYTSGVNNGVSMGILDISFGF